MIRIAIDRASPLEMIKRCYNVLNYNETQLEIEERALRHATATPTDRASVTPLPHDGDKPLLASPASSRMSRQRTRDTEPELTLRRELHARGMRYRVDYPVPGNRRRSIDIAFVRIRLGVFVDGCFWHGCPTHGTWPMTNAAWWENKIKMNRARDDDTNRLLREHGWESLRLWEHEVATAARRVIEAYSRRRRDVGR